MGSLSECSAARGVDARSAGRRTLGTCLLPPLSTLYFLFIAPQAILGSKALNFVYRLDVGERCGERGLHPS